MPAPLRIAVLGAGACGLSAAYRLTRLGHRVDVYERWPGLGGQAATMELEGGIRLEHYYHYWYPSDRAILGLCRELGVEDVEWHPARMGFVVDGRQHAFTTPMDLLRFKPLSLVSRLRVGLAAVQLHYRHRDVAPFESVTAREWIEEAMGREAWTKIWSALLRGKFGDRAEDISMAWLWSKFRLRRPIQGEQARHEVLGYPRHSFEPLWQALRRAIEAAGGRIRIDCPAARVARVQDGYGFLVHAGEKGSFRRGLDPRRFEANGEPPEFFDAVLAALPSHIFERLLDDELAKEVGDGYLSRSRSIDYHAAVCMLLQLDRPFADAFWTNVADPEIPFVGLIEHTNLVGSERYGGRHFLYVGNYVSPEDRLAQLDGEELYAVYEPGLRRIRPDFSADWIEQRWLFREPAAQPIVTVGYRERIPPLQTPASGLVMANTTQIYPEDRGTNYGVVQAGQAVDALLSGLGDVADPTA